MDMPQLYKSFDNRGNQSVQIVKESSDHLEKKLASVKNNLCLDEIQVKDAESMWSSDISEDDMYTDASNCEIFKEIED